ncbi:MAG: peptidoglycan bridge formation glycyltransferase FemA/FemB family protein [Candidatus Buchananbacteria bacterium]|nr:peptidoglycan bridge formation glycyltransferase FemA/FemB family protein [Candidatus Buchananbacteria bacterium]
MKVIIADDSYKEKWNEFVFKNSNDFGLLQSWEWGIFQTALGRPVFRFVLEDGDKILATSLVIRQPLKFGKSYFYIPRGPIMVDDEAVAQKQIDMLEFLFNEIKNIASKAKAVFLRLDPAWRDNNHLQKILNDSGFIFSGQVQPKSTLILDLVQSETDLLKKMKAKTRYNIKVAQKSGVEIDKGEKYFDDFWTLMLKTSKRNEIISHPKNYYKKLLQVLGESSMAELVVAKYENKIIAANIMIKIGSWAVYLYGSSDYEYRNKMAPYLLQWQSITYAKEAGCKYYDFWGIDEAKWPGVSRFKKGFDELREPTDYIGSWDEVYSGLWYNIYRLITHR